MMSVNEIFFELIRVALGTQETLSRTPSKAEWAELYAMSKKQSLVGICFAGLQKLHNFDKQEPNINNPQPDSTHNQEPITKNLDEVQYLQWMGMAAKIQQRNEIVNMQCVEVQKRLRGCGMHSVILKGQGVASYYPAYLKGLRQPGDIDAYVFSVTENIIRWCKTQGSIDHIDYVHCMVHGVVDNSVELHYRFGYSTNLLKNYSLQNWFNNNITEEVVNHGNHTLYTPSKTFNAVYLIYHIYKHLFTDCVGIKQILDYYYLTIELDNTECSEKIRRQLKKLGLLKLTSGIMWILKNQFGLKEEYLICQPSENEGRRFLQYILTGSFTNEINFRGLNIKKEIVDYYLLFNYPSEILCRPFWNLFHFVWKKFTLIKMSLHGIDV